jgi:hypothetical protein
MSGNAALSAARKRRASSSPGVSGNSGSGSGSGSGVGNGVGGSYYTGNNVQNIQAMLNQPPVGKMIQQQHPRGPALDGPQIPINVYENIELIKQQIEQRTKVIQTQGSSMPPEKVRILMNQNEVQAQILKQRMLMVQEMEMAASIQTPKMATSPVQMAASQSANNIPNKNEPQFIYEKGIPRPNPNYMSGGGNANTNRIVETRAVQPAVTRSTPHSNFPTAVLTPFVSMSTSTGATPPPLVILKSHDEKIGEHDAVLNDLANRVNYIHSRVDELSSGSSESHAKHRPEAISEAAEDGDDAEDEEDGDETVLLMDTVMNDLINSRDFVQGIVDKIVNETNLSETIMKIEPIIKENQELRSLIHSQQKMLNEMNTMVLRLLNQQQYYPDTEAEAADADESSGMDENGLYQTTTTPTEPEVEVEVEAETEHDTEAEAEAESSDKTELEIPLHSYFVPNMDNVVMSVCETSADEPEHAESEQEQDQEQEQEPDQEQEQETEPNDAYAEAPHFPSDSRIALVVNEI